MGGYESSSAKKLTEMAETPFNYKGSVFNSLGSGVKGAVDPEVYNKTMGLINSQGMTDAQRNAYTSLGLGGINASFNDYMKNINQSNPDMTTSGKMGMAGGVINQFGKGIGDLAKNATLMDMQKQMQDQSLGLQNYGNLFSMYNQAMGQENQAYLGDQVNKLKMWDMINSEREKEYQSGFKIGGLVNLFSKGLDFFGGGGLNLFGNIFGGGKGNSLGEKAV
jgi:hypothetical protein